ncbi:MAG: hypothetical protein WC091_16550 [Sulfuricellaceae bacterium]
MLNIPNKTLLATAILLALLLAGAVVQKLLPAPDQTVAATLPLDKSCDLQRAVCSSILPGGGRVSFSIEPRPIPVLRPVKLSVTVQGANVKKVEVDFTGVDMKMGYNHPQLQAMGGGRFDGEATLPICSTGSMAWRATVLVETDGRWVAAPFEFVTSRN